MALPISSAKTYLGYREATENEIKQNRVISTAETKYTKLIDIKNIPDLGGEPETIDTTTLSNEKTMSSILGLQTLDNLSYTANWDRDATVAIDALKDIPLVFAVLLQDGSLIEYIGTVMWYKSGAEVNAVQEMVVLTSTSGADPELNKDFLGSYDKTKTEDNISLVTASV